MKQVKFFKCASCGTKFFDRADRDYHNIFCPKPAVSKFGKKLAAERGD